MDRLDHIEAVAVPITAINCDTDQILPARYLQKPRSDNFGHYLFNAFRFREDGSEIEDFILNRAPYRSARIVVGNRNFGCGSSREHAVWALYDYGIRVAIAPSFGDIFFNNCLKNGLLPIILPGDVVTPLLDELEANPGAEIEVDLPAQTVKLPDGSSYSFEVNAFAKDCLVNGIDELDYTLARAAQIDAFERGAHGG
ncbi:3-isopropylmalate/(R)-2-methylmalate dehydratase small subunit [Rhizobium sp. BK313]|jgi:3-isopropylmalate/(R)-2-methylmalate dehydratase small subunit|uniref:3-isopropylmalate dehydratase small subunit n=1 Tax=Rhizobium sp. BK313 TaxID=2587081 RepID=UPI00105B2567|nr:3-isopropylmalate dehydratase small subunit [Rhizobium sp. BK313]MBB3459204.1 3-isopropylmalate/(R)-2-methylmalate dehydratase small subunit [Rhizobium sp. BK313]